MVSNIYSQSADREFDSQNKWLDEKKNYVAKSALTKEIQEK